MSKVFILLIFLCFCRGGCGEAGLLGKGSGHLTDYEDDFALDVDVGGRGEDGF